MYFKTTCENSARSTTARVMGELTINGCLLIYTQAQYKLDHTVVMRQHPLIAQSKRQ